MEWLPRVRAEVANVALPEESKVLVPSVAVPFLNVTVPVGMAVPGEFAITVAVKVTLWLCRDGLSEDVTELVVPSLFTV